MMIRMNRKNHNNGKLTLAELGIFLDTNDKLSEISDKYTYDLGWTDSPTHVYEITEDAYLIFSMAHPQLADYVTKYKLD